ncbi:Reverse transcriptase RNA-dependent DNA polymerase [Trinorchestia longiramus]|nr:Reverse transcriptase RNA-dependent DNA polymerase [Trinorchestia longiramus]
MTVSAKYKMKDLGKLSYFLGVSVMQTKNEVFLEQSAYTKALLSRFGMDNANSVATPVDVNADLVTTSDEVEECDKDLYQSAVDCVIIIVINNFLALMYTPNKQQIRHILLFEFHEGNTASSAAKTLKDTYGNDVANEKTCRRWFSRFKKDDFSLKDEPRAGCSKQLNFEQLHAAIDENPTCTTRELSKTLNWRIGKQLPPTCCVYATSLYKPLSVLATSSTCTSLKPRSL